MIVRNKHETIKLREILNNPYPLKIEEALECVRANADPKVKDDSGNTILHLLRGPFKATVVKELVAADPTLVNEKGKNGLTPLQVQINEIDHFNVENIMILAELGANLMVCNDSGDTILHRLVGGRFDEAIIKKLVQLAPGLLRVLDRNNDTPLQTHMNDFEHFKAQHAMCLVRLGAPLKSKNQSGNIRLLRDQFGNTLLHLLAGWRFKEAIVRELVEKEPLHINAAGKDNQTPLQVQLNDFEHSKFGHAMSLVSLGADPHCTDLGGTPLLHRVIAMADLAKSADKTAITDLINNHTIDINLRDNFGRTPLLILMKESPSPEKLAFIEEFLAQGAQLEVIDDKGQTPFHYAAYVNDLIVGKWLLAQKGTLITVRDKNGDTPLFTACKAGSLDFAKWLVVLNADIKDTNDLSQTLLHAACADNAGQLETVVWLVESAKINIHAIDKNGKTALTVNSRLRQEIKDLLLAPDPVTKAQAILQAKAKAKAEAKAEAEARAKRRADAEDKAKANSESEAKDKEQKSNANVSQLRGRPFSSLLSILGTLESIEALIDPTEKNPVPRTNFIKAVEDLIADLNTDLLAQEAPNKWADMASLQQSTAGILADKTVNLLKILKLNPKPETQLNAIRQYEAGCKATKGWGLFAKLIALVCIAAVGFVIGAAIGMGIGIAVGAWTGPGAFVTAALGMATGAAIGVMAAAAVTGLTVATLGGIALFKASKLDNKVDEVITMGIKLVQ